LPLMKYWNGTTWIPLDSAKINDGTLKFTPSDIANYNIESTGHGIISGLTTIAQSTPDMTVNVATGTVHMANGVRYVPTASPTLAITVSDVTNPRTDIVYVSNTGVISYLASALGTAAVAGSETYTITTNAVAADTVTINGIIFTAIASGATGNQFNVGTDTTITATNLTTTLNANATINALYTATSSTNVITLTEKVAGGGNTPTVATYTGTVVITNGTIVTSAVAIYPSPPTIPSGGFLLAQIAVGAGVTSIITANITDKRKIKNTTDTNKNEISVLLENYNTYSSNIDSNGIFTIVDYKRSDATLYLNSTLSGGTSPNYVTDTWTFYEVDGTTVSSTLVWTLGYDSNGNLISRTHS